ncbi:hypothetical protein J132_08299 [Termitomyces sp. J132]|nr:hypothetical protein J132_08299 [Termitomyces sp. J132]
MAAAHNRGFDITIAELRHVDTRIPVYTFGRLNVSFLTLSLDPHHHFNLNVIYVLTPQSILTAAAVVGAVVTPFAAAPVLGLVGFSAAGPVAGTLAAGVQAGMGNVVAGSAFALAQSIAMGGAAVPAFGVLAGSGIAGTVSYGVAKLFGV